MPGPRFLTFSPPLYGSRQSLADQVVVACQACAFMEPAGSGLVAASPVEPVPGVFRRVRAVEGACEKSPDLGDGQRDHSWFRRQGLTRCDWRRCLGVSAVSEQGGGDGADGQGGP